MRTILLLAALAALGACDSKPANQSGEANQSNTALEQPEVAVEGVDRSHAGKMAPETEFSGPEGETVRLADFEGTPLLVNLWATWCAPCVKELPTLDALARDHRVDADLVVMAVSQDKGPPASVRAFLDKTGAKYLPAYQDADMALSGAVNAQVLPTSILYDAHGREVWRYVGDLDWTGEEAAKLLDERAGSAD